MNANNDSLNVQVKLTAEDLKDLWSESRIKYVIWLTVPFGIYLAYFVFAEIVNEGFTLVGTFNVVVYGPVAIVGLSAPFLLPRLRARQLIRRGPTLAELRQYSFSEPGVHFDGQLMSCDLRWNSFYKIVESRRSFLFYLSPAFGIVIPKKCFPSGEDVMRFRTILHTNVKGKLKLHA